MTNESPGIKSLNERLSAVENTIGTGTISFADQLISSVTSSLKTDLNTLLQHYEDGLTNLGINLNNVTLADLVKMVPYTIQYVETNASIISGILKKDLTSQFKLNTALTFIKQYFKTDEQFLISWINHEVDLLFNRGQSTLADTLTNSNKKSINTPPSTVSKSKGKKFFFKLRS
jgi:hypothetical protein